MLKKTIYFFIGSCSLPILLQAQSVESANPEHIELFDNRNFCVLCTFNDAILSPDTLRSYSHINANLSASYVYRTVMDNLDLTFGFLYAIKGEYFSITNSIVRMINITYSDLPYFTFTNNSGELVNFTGSGLNFGNFRYAQLDSPIFTGTSIEETDFTGAQLNDASFNHTRVYTTNFTDANLTNADFTEARIKNANFTRANLAGAKLTSEQLATSIVCDAILPDGTLGECE